METPNEKRASYLQKLNVRHPLISIRMDDPKVSAILEKIGKGKKSEFIKTAIVQAEELKAYVAFALDFFQKHKAYLNAKITPEERAMFIQMDQVE
jgi:hypothetical protein